MKSICILALSSIPAIVCAQQAPSQEDVFQLCLQLAQRQQRLIESVHDEASGELAAAELKALGAAVIGLYSSEPMSKLSTEQQQQLLSCVNAVVQKAQELKKLGFEVLQSKANFVFAKNSAINGKDLYLGLKSRGILVRYFDKPRLSDFVRITIGSRKQMEALIKTLKEMLI